MRCKRLVVLLATVVTASALLHACEKGQPQRIILPEGKTAQIAFIVGDVFFRPLNESEWVKAEVGDTLTEGTVIKTAENSYCELVIRSGTIFRMKDRSELQLAMLPADERRNRSLIKLERGELFARVRRVAFRSRDSVQTDTATLSSKGTEFLVYVEKGTLFGKTEVMVSEGRVKLQLNVIKVAQDELPKELKPAMRELHRGVSVRQGHKLEVSSEKIQRLDSMIGEIVQRGGVDAGRVAALKNEVDLETMPLDENDRKRLETFRNLSLEFQIDKTFYISPNFDGTNDEFILSTEGLGSKKLRGWKLVVLDTDFRVQKVLQSRLPEEGEEVTIPREIRWNMVSLHGNIVDDGLYVYEFYTMEKGGSYLPEVKGVIVVDTVPPRISLNVREKLFSPNGDGIKDTVLIDIEAEKDIPWTCTIATPGGIIVRTFDFGKDIPSTLEWDGRGENGLVLPEGVYTISFSGRDRAGNLTTQSIHGITLDVRERQASVDVDHTVFSPNGDGILDTVTFRPLLSDRYRIDTWDLIVQTERGETARRFRGRSFMPEEIVWDGKPQKGTTTEFFPEDLPSGRYYYFLKVIYRSGVNTYSFKRELLIDTDPPVLGVELEPDPFSPDGDGTNDLLIIRPRIEDLTPIRGWKATVYSADGSVFKNLSGVSRPAHEITWDGISDTGQLVDSGEDYYLVFEATDSGFNTAVSEPVPFSVDILVMQTERGLKIRVSNVEFGFNTAELKGEKTFALLDKVVVVLKKYGRYSVIIEGHTDSTGDEGYNLLLSRSRAESVGKYLIDHGIGAERLRYEGHGSRYPIDGNETKEGRRRNRRVEFLLLKKK